MNWGTSMKKLVLAASLLATAAVASAQVADTAGKAPAAAVSSGGYYVWVDGIYDRVALPSYTLGLHNILAGLTLPDVGPVQGFDPRLNGSGVRGAIGYRLPRSTVRFEIGGSYIAANGSNPAFGENSTGAVGVVLLTGVVPGSAAFNCIARICSTSSNLSSDFSAWQFNGKVAADWTYGSINLTPSAAIFGGRSRVGQTLNQAFTQILGAVLTNSGVYSASTTLRWTDIGARAGLDVAAPLGPALVAQLGGWVGLASRHTAFSGNDAASSAPLTLFNSASSISTNATKGVFLANLEAGLAYKMSPALTLHGFAGLNYDSDVPGISAPNGGDLFLLVPTAAGISYGHETSFYAGGGLLWRFGS